MSDSVIDTLLSIYESIEGALNRFESLAVIIGGLTTLLIAILVTSNVVSRAYLNRPFPIRFIVEEYLMVAAVFLPMSILQKFEGNVRVEIFEDRFSHRLKASLKLFHRVIILFIFIYLGRWYFQESLASFNSSVRSVGELGLPLFPTWWIATIGIVALTLRIFFQIIEQIMDLWAG